MNTKRGRPFNADKGLPRKQISAFRLDADLEPLIEAKRRQTGESFSGLVNSALRAYLVTQRDQEHI